MLSAIVAFAAVSSHELEWGFDYGGFTFICWTGLYTDDLCCMIVNVSF